MDRWEKKKEQMRKQRLRQILRERDVMKAFAVYLSSPTGFTSRNRTTSVTLIPEKDIEHYASAEAKLKKTFPADCLALEVKLPGYTPQKGGVKNGR